MPKGCANVLAKQSSTDRLQFWINGTLITENILVDTIMLFGLFHTKPVISLISF